MIGCGGTPTASTPAPVVQNSPQTQAHNVNKLFADSLNALVKDAIASRSAGKLSAAATRQIEDWAVPATTVSDKIATEIISTDAWPVQKQKIAVLLTGFQVPTLGGNIDPVVSAALAATKALLLQLQAQVTP
jgi:hypothetical protein